MQKLVRQMNSVQGKFFILSKSANKSSINSHLLWMKYFLLIILKSDICRGGHAQLFFQSATAIPQLAGSTSTIAIPQLFTKCCSATETPQFRNRNFFLSPQLQVRNLRVSPPQFSAIFWLRSSLKLDIFFTTRCFMLLRGF